MLSGVFNYPYSVFRTDLRNLAAILKAERILHHSGEWLEIGDDRDMVQNIRRIWSYFIQRYPKEDERIEIGSAFMACVSQIESCSESCLADGTMDEFITSGFEVIQEPLLEATHYVHTAVEIEEWGDSKEEKMEFIFEIARSRFGYDK